MTDKEKLRKQAREEYARATAPTGKAHYEVRASAKKAYHNRMKEIDKMEG